MMMRNKKILLGVIFICFLIQLGACGEKKNDKAQEGIAENVQDEIGKGTFFIHPDSCISVSLMNDGERVALSEEDSHVVLGFLNAAMYNKERNDSGIQYKMVSPDYTFVIQFESEDKLAQFWVSESLLLYEAKWYNILSQFAIEPVLEKY